MIRIGIKYNKNKKQLTNYSVAYLEFVYGRGWGGVLP